LPVQRCLGQQVCGHGCGDEQEEQDCQLVQADAAADAAVLAAGKEDRRSEQQRPDAERRRLGRAVQTRQEIRQARQTDRTEAGRTVRRGRSATATAASIAGFIR
jgi:hypothetical protein